ncbi:MAG: hypothetical protein IJD95_06300 [Clostridia bacterium]|nr:hypothetical protein [Clostridia bacterium]
MKKFLLIALTLTLVLALAVAPAAASIPDWTDDGGATYEINSNGYLVITALQNTAIAFDKDLTGNYSVELEVLLPKTPDQSDNKFVMSVECSNASWLSGFWFRAVHHTDDSGYIQFNDGTDGSYAFYDPIAAPVVKTGDGEWNKMAVVCNNGAYEYYINDLLVFDSAPANTSGNKLVIGANCATLAAATPDYGSFVVRNLKITTSEGTVTYFGGNANLGPADIEVVAVAGAMIVALMAAAFVVKARKA